MFHLTVIAGFCLILIASSESELLTDRIINGKSVPISEFPYLVSIQNSGIHFCGGSILSPKIIITAGHCIKGVINEKLSDLTIRAGATMWTSMGQVKNIVGMKAHHKYNPKTKAFDIGLLQLGSPLKFDKSVQKIELADGVPADGKIGQICGWGVTAENGFTLPTVLRSAEVISISRKNCSQPPWEYNADEILPSMICAKGNTTDACQGDSGGPYVSKSSGKLWGVVSWGRGCARPGHPGVFCAIASCKKWILENSENF